MADPIEQRSQQLRERLSGVTDILKGGPMAEQSKEERVARAIAESCIGWEDYVRQGAFWGAMARAAIAAADAWDAEHLGATPHPAGQFAGPIKVIKGEV